MSITTRGWGGHCITTSGWGCGIAAVIRRGVKRFTMFIKRMVRMDVER